jgi:molybdopterin-binding protein
MLDEPAAHADEKSVALIESACRLYARSGRSVVVATHRGGFGYRIADRMFELRNGRLEPGTSNILSGEVSRRDAAFLYFTAGEAEFRVPLRDGDFRVAVIPGEDVLLSVHPLESSARNCIEGTVTRLRTGPDGTLVASVDCGIPLEAVITSSAAVDLHLEAGRRVYATFKASSVRLY